MEWNAIEYQVTSLLLPKLVTCLLCDMSVKTCYPIDSDNSSIIANFMDGWIGPFLGVCSFRKIFV